MTQIHAQQDTEHTPPRKAHRVTVWDIWIRAGDSTDLDEQLTLTSDASYAYWFEGGVVIQTDPTGFGDFNVERVLPWSRITDYRKSNVYVAEANR